MKGAGGASFETLAVGACWSSPGRTLTEAGLLHACMTSGDWHPIHADTVHAAATALGQRVFQGTYGLHVAVGIATAFPPAGACVVEALSTAASVAERVDCQRLDRLAIAPVIHMDHFLKETK